MDIDFALAGTVILSGIGIVFLVLILLTLILMLFGKLMGGTGKKKEEPAAPAQMKKEVPPQAAPASPVKAEVVEDGISDEIVAVISASVASVLGGGNFAIKSVRRARENKAGRGAWSMAGLSQNTSPF